LREKKLQVFTITKRLQRSIIIPRKLNRWQKLQMLFSGRAFLGWAIPEGFLKPAQIFLVKCKEHGFYVTYPQHERFSLDCPLCTLDKKADL
jgi:hypothetical protein